MRFGYETLDQRGAGRPIETFSRGRRAADTAPDGIPVRPDASYTGKFMTPDGVYHWHGNNSPVTACSCACNTGPPSSGGATSRAQASSADAELRHMRLRLLELERLS